MRACLQKNLGACRRAPRACRCGHGLEKADHRQGRAGGPGGRQVGWDRCPSGSWPRAPRRLREAHVPGWVRHGDGPLGRLAVGLSLGFGPGPAACGEEESDMVRGSARVPVSGSLGPDHPSVTTGQGPWVLSHPGPLWTGVRSQDEPRPAGSRLPVLAGSRPWGGRGPVSPCLGPGCTLSKLSVPTTPTPGLPQPLTLASHWPPRLSFQLGPEGLQALP